MKTVIIFIAILGLVTLFILSVRKCLSNTKEVIGVIEEVGLKSIVEELWYGKEE